MHSLSLVRSDLHQDNGLRVTKEAWEKLREKFEGSDRVKSVKLLTLKREFENLRMKEDERVVEKIMINLPARFEFKISAIEESCDLKTLNVAELISKLQEERGIFISQQKYASDLLKRFKMEGCTAVSTPLVADKKLSKENAGARADSTNCRSLIGSLLYLTITRPDLMYTTSLLSRFMQESSEKHMVAAKRFLRYVKGTLDDGSGVFLWSSRKQEVVALSSTKAEYVAATGATNQATWLRKVMEDLNLSQNSATVIWVDNKSAISVAKNSVLHGRSKHIKVKFHALRQAEASQEIKLEHCKSEEQIADIMTKSIRKAKFEMQRKQLGVLKKNLKEEC
ncbi:hypothetical protein GH714_043312 [Hevea brasiliensis]|uniref:Reverse transcriptase Ty1/copia-type domain-containing protein n=1 Tax=Hevea brasiliensis TaxID=3981 RepID=A0A6A6K2D3_HEVBR|nr:hypothetical protein GH714_043312 [Hevea brasiliensis]